MLIDFYYQFSFPIIRAILLCDAFYRASSEWIYVVPWGLRRALCWLKERYSNPPVYITENGFSDSTGTTDDHDRIDYLRRHINEVLKGNIPLSLRVIFEFSCFKISSMCL